MLSNRTQINLWKLLIFLTLINYQCVTIILNDFILFKFLRDIVLLFILLLVLLKNQDRTQFSITTLMLIVFFLFLIAAAFQTEGLSLIVLFYRKYLFPIGVLYSVLLFSEVDEEIYLEMLQFFLNLLSILALWGIFQAYILGDQFLMDLGYPTGLSKAYGKITLNSSFYFGNLGIQRVVSTVSNSNVFALILGVVIIIMILNYNSILTTVWNKLKLLCIMAAYVLTFSRANFLSMIIVFIICMWPYIPKKVLMGVGILVCVAGGAFIIRDKTGLALKLINWVKDSLSFKESSAAGRMGIWLTALKKVKESPLGIGFGKVGSFAQNSGTNDFYHCENSYLAVALDLGWLGLVSWLGFLGSLVYKIKVNAGRILKKDGKIASAILLYFMIACFFSNHIYDMEAVAVVFFLVGLSINKIQVQSEDMEKCSWNFQ